MAPAACVIGIAYRSSSGRQRRARGCRPPVPDAAVGQPDRQVGLRSRRRADVGRRDRVGDRGAGLRGRGSAQCDRHDGKLSTSARCRTWARKGAAGIGPVESDQEVEIAAVHGFKRARYWASVRRPRRVSGPRARATPSGSRSIPRGQDELRNARHGPVRVRHGDVAQHGRAAAGVAHLEVDVRGLRGEDGRHLGREFEDRHADAAGEDPLPHVAIGIAVGVAPRDLGSRGQQLAVGVPEARQVLRRGFIRALGLDGRRGERLDLREARSGREVGDVKGARRAVRHRQVDVAVAGAEPMFVTVTL